MSRHEYRTMSSAPKNGTPIIANLDGVESVIAWGGDEPWSFGWHHWAEDDGGITPEPVTGPMIGWRPLFAGVEDVDYAGQ